jgi:hypothetical protein
MAQDCCRQSNEPLLFTPDLEEPATKPRSVSVAVHLRDRDKVAGRVVQVRVTLAVEAGALAGLQLIDGCPVFVRGIRGGGCQNCLFSDRNGAALSDSKRHRAGLTAETQTLRMKRPETARRALARFVPR